MEKPSPELSEVLHPPQPSGLLIEIVGACREAQDNPESQEKEQVDRETDSLKGGPGGTRIEGAISLHFR